MRSVLPGITSLRGAFPGEQVISLKWCGKEASSLESELLKAKKMV